MKKLIAASILALLTVGGGSYVAQADPGPNGNNDHGLCTAYFNGNKTGHGKKDTPPPPFAALEAAADDDDDDTPVEQDVYDWCQAAGIGGNPAHGRYPSCFDDDDCTN